MSVLYLTSGGVLEWRLDDADEVRNPLPAGATNLIRFDPAAPANATVFADVKYVTGQYTIVAGVLRKDGVPVAGFPVGEDAGLAASRRAGAKAVYDALGLEGKVLRALVLALVGELNTVRQRLVAQDTAVSQATSLADLKTRWAAVVTAHPMPDRTGAQARTALRNRLDSGAADQPPA